MAIHGITRIDERGRKNPGAAVLAKEPRTKLVDPIQTKQSRAMAPQRGKCYPKFPFALGKD